VANKRKKTAAAVGEAAPVAAKSAAVGEAAAIDATAAAVAAKSAAEAKQRKAKAHNAAAAAAVVEWGKVASTADAQQIASDKCENREDTGDQSVDHHANAVVMAWEKMVGLTQALKSAYEAAKNAIDDAQDRYFEAVNEVYLAEERHEHAIKRHREAEDDDSEPRGGSMQRIYKQVVKDTAHEEQRATNKKNSDASVKTSNNARQG
jgi:hypothetical protein